VTISALIYRFRWAAASRRPVPFELMSLLRCPRVGFRLVALMATCVVGCPLSGCGGHAAQSMGRTETLNWGVLRLPREPDDVLPKQLESALREDEGPGFGAQALQTARRVLPNTPVWLIRAGNGELCIARLEYALISTARGSTFPPIASHGCVSEHAALLGRLVDVRSLATAPTTSEAPAEVIGIAPDRVASVTVRGDRPRLTTVPVTRNAYSVTVTGPQQVVFRTRVHGRRTRVVIPLTTPSASNTGPAVSRGTGSF
jgi:hypothetical protein